MLSPETINEIHSEEKQVMKWENEIKKRILKMTDSVKKQMEWRKHFAPRTVADDSYIYNNPINLF